MNEMTQSPLVQRLQAVQEKINNAVKNAGRRPEEVTLIAVSKRHSPKNIKELFEFGHLEFGESYVQEALKKQEALEDCAIRWHFIGGLQTNKAKYCAGKFALIHAVGSHKLAQTLHKQAEKRGVVQPALIQVNVGREEQKSGIMEEGLPELLESALEMPGLDVQGLMCMPPYDPDQEKTRPYFAKLRELRDAMQKSTGARLPHLSMGMSTDCAAAVEEGATLVRVGTDIFGQRPVS